MHFLIVLAIVLLLFRFFPVTMLVLGAALTIFVIAIIDQGHADNAKFDIQEASRIAYLQTHSDLQGWIKPQ
jgi:peptidoglycan/LPS O-acetylase OafA/YrhL